MTDAPTMATLLRDRLVTADGTPTEEDPQDSATWSDNPPELQTMGRGAFTIVAADGSTDLAQIDDRATAMTVRARFEPQAPCPQPRMGDLLAVELGSAGLVFEVRLTGDDLASVAPGWTSLVDTDMAPGELLLELREDVGLTFGGAAHAG